MDHAQLELFAHQSPIPLASNPEAGRRIAAEDLLDAALIAGIPDASLADAPALAAEAGRRGLGEAVQALAALCTRFLGYGGDCRVPEQIAALEALCGIGGAEASRSVNQMIVKGIVQGPNLAAALIVAARLGVKLNSDVALPLLRHAEPSVRAAACACVRAGGEIVATLIELLTDLNGEVATAAACTLGGMGRIEVLNSLKRHIVEMPSPRVIEALAGVADEEAIVFLARLGRNRPELADAVLLALDEIDHAKATVAASRLRSWLTSSDRH
jgi:hypothetical protein